MRAEFQITDGISPGAREVVARLDGAGRQGALEVIGMVIRDWAVEAFVNAAMRPATWALKMDGTASTLQKEFALRRSLRVEATADTVTIGSDKKYALIHQVGGTIRAKTPAGLRFFAGGRWWRVKQVVIPARPYLPVSATGEIMPQVRDDATAALEDYLRG